MLIIHRFPRYVKYICHPERNEVKSRDLGTYGKNKLKLVHRSFDSLCSLRMTRGEGQDPPLRLLLLVGGIFLAIDGTDDDGFLCDEPVIDIIQPHGGGGVFLEVGAELAHHAAEGL